MPKKLLRHGCKWFSIPNIEILSYVVLHAKLFFDVLERFKTNFNSKMGACHNIQDGGINVGRVYWIQQIQMIISQLLFLPEIMVPQLFSNLKVRFNVSLHTQVMARPFVVDL